MSDLARIVRDKNGRFLKIVCTGEVRDVVWEGDVLMVRAFLPGGDILTTVFQTNEPLPAYPKVVRNTIYFTEPPVEPKTWRPT